MKVMILSTSTGQGHNSCSNAMKEFFEKNGHEVFLEDILNCGKTKTSKVVSSFYTNVTVHTPGIFGFFYNLGGVISSCLKNKSVVYFVASFRARQLYKIILQEKPDVILCPHLFSAETITKVKRKYKIDIPIVSISTDYTCIPFLRETEPDYFTVSNENLIENFVAYGIPKEKIVVMGIPVLDKFTCKNDKEIARKQFGLTAKHVYTVMGGSMGFGNLPEIANGLTKLDDDCQVVVLCGHNQSVYNKLLNKENIIPLLFTENVDVLMDASDVLLTKPGGLSSTEAMNKNIPIVFTPPIPGCETRNSKFLKKYGVGITSTSVKNAIRNAVSLANDEDAQAKMLVAQKKFIPENASKNVGDFAISLANQNQ